MEDFSSLAVGNDFDVFFSNKIPITVCYLLPETGMSTEECDPIQYSYADHQKEKAMFL
jgi:hypothetical protein